MFNIGFPEVAVIAGMTLLVFGPRRTQELAQALGKGVRDFRKALESDPKQSENPPVEPPRVNVADGIEPR